MMRSFLRKLKRPKYSLGFLVFLILFYLLSVLFNYPEATIAVLEVLRTRTNSSYPRFYTPRPPEPSEQYVLTVNIPDEMVQWQNKKQSLCDNGFTGFYNLFAELTNVTIDASKNSNHRGGEEIKEVANQPETLEYLMLKKDFFTLYCKGELYQKYAFNRQSPNFNWFNSLSFLELNASLPEQDPSSVINTTVVAVQRYEYVNIYHTMTDWYNTFIMMIFFKLKPKKFFVLWMDAHPKGSLDSVWEHLFGPVIQAYHLQQKTQFTKLIWSINGYDSFLNQHNKFSVPLLEEFRHFVLDSFKVDTISKKNCKNLNILFIFRRDYVAHPRNMEGQVQRKIANEDELISSCQQQFPEYNTSGRQLDSLPFSQQLQLVASTDILIGMHGAGLTMALFLPKHAALIELYPMYFSNNNIHFQSIARWRQLSYFQWQNSVQSYERDNYNTYIPPNDITDLILQSKNKLCG